MMLNATFVNGKIQVKINNEEKIEKTLKLKQSTIDKLDKMSADWDVTSSTAIDFIVKTFYELYKKPLADTPINERERQLQEKEARIQKTIELRKLNKYTRRELAEKVGVSRWTMDAYIKEINRRNLK